MTAAAIVGTVLGGVTLLGGAWKAAPSCWSFVKAVAKVPLTLERIYDEFRPNGGSSMRDAINRIEHTRLPAIEQRLDALEKKDPE